MKLSISLIISLLALTGCSSIVTLDLSNVNQSTPPTISTTITYPTWQTVQSGIDFKQVTSEIEGHTELFDLVRIDPEQVQLEFVVDEALPKTVSSWQESLGATVVINGSYFDEDYALVTRTKTNSAEFGPWLTGHTGMIWQRQSGWLIAAADPLTPGSAEQLLQSYPLLVSAGKSAVTQSIDDTAQRSAIGIDDDGYLYLIIAEYGTLTLSQLSQALTTADLPAMDTVLNLDGGSSTGLAVLSDTVNYLDDSFVVPSVIVLY